MQGGDFLSGAAGGFFGSLGASGFGAVAGEWGSSFGGNVFFGVLSGGIGAELTGGNFWVGAVTGGIVAGLNHAMHKIKIIENNTPPKKTSEEYQYNGKSYDSKSELYSAILADQASEQFGIKDIVALAIAIDGTFPSINKVGALGSGNKTSYASKYGSKLFPQKMSFRLPTHFKNGSWRYTKVLGRFLGRVAGPIGWSILAYDVGKVFYNTQTIYNSIVK